MARSVRVDRCVCHDVPFARLFLIARAHDAASLEALAEHVAFGQTCGLCRPYVARMLETGETVFSELLPPEDLGDP